MSGDLPQFGVSPTPAPVPPTFAPTRLFVQDGQFGCYDPSATMRPAAEAAELGIEAVRVGFEHTMRVSVPPLQHSDATNILHMLLQTDLFRSLDVKRLRTDSAGGGAALPAPPQAAPVSS